MDILYKLSDPIERSRVSVFEAEHGFKPAPGSDLRSFGFAWGSAESEPAVPSAQVAERAVPVLSGTFVSQGWNVREKTDQELAADLEVWRSNAFVTRTQFAGACFISGLITAVECKDWAASNALPANVETEIVAAYIDPVEQVIALTKALGEVNIRRDNPIVNLLATSSSFDMTETEVDQLFTLAEWIE